MKSTIPVSKIKTEFSLNESTCYGGSKVYLEYVEKIKLADALKTICCTKAKNRLFPLHRIFLYLLIGWTLGCERLFHFRRLQNDSLLRLFLGGRCPHHSLLNKELIRLGKENPTIRDELRSINHDLIRPCLPTSLILDLDSTVETVYGDQANAAKGTNSHNIRFLLSRDSPVCA